MRITNSNAIYKIWTQNNANSCSMDIRTIVENSRNFGRSIMNQGPITNSIEFYSNMRNLKVYASETSVWSSITNLE
jgi:hypothetical protein